MVSTTTKVGAGLLALLTIAIVVLLLPLFQVIFYEVFIAHPEILYWLVIGGGLTALAYSTGHPTLATSILGATVVMALLIGPFVSGVYMMEDMSNSVQANSEKLETLPNTSESQMRVLPRSVADEYASSSMQYPQYRLTDSDISEVNGTYRWSYGVVPDNLIVSLTGTQRGALYVNMEQTDKSVKVTKAHFKNGRGQLWFDSYEYQSILHSPFKSHNWKTTFNGQTGDTSFIAHSTTCHKWKFRLFPIPQPYTVPTHCSVEVMYQNGTIDSLSPQEAQQSELLDGESFYPYHLARLKVDSMRYHKGALNAWFTKEGVLQIADLPEGGNSWPLVVPTQAPSGSNSTELTYFIATEPTGSGNGVYEVWAIDAQSGETGVQSYDESQIGPQKAVNFVERQPSVNRLSNAQAIAPIPVVKGDTLYWHVKVIPKSESGVIYTAFVNAKTGDVTLLEGTEPIYAFLSEEQVEHVRNETNQTSTKGGVKVTVIVTDENGNITGTTNITVPEGGAANIKVEDQTANNSTQASG